MIIEIPDDLPTTLAETLAAMAKTAPVVDIVGTDGAHVLAQIERVFERDDHGVNVIAYPWVETADGGGGPDLDKTLTIPAELIESISPC